MKFALMVVVAAMTGSAMGQEGDQPAGPVVVQPPEMPKREVQWSFRPRTFLGFNSDLDGATGDVTVSRLGADLSVEVPIATMSALELGFETEYSRYDFEGVTGFIGGTGGPFQDIYREVFTARYGQQQTLQLGWFVGGYVGFSHEEGAEIGDSVVGGVYGGVAYYLSKDLRVGAAMGVFARIEDDPLVLPIPTIDWKLDEQWRLSTAGKPGVTLFYSPSESWTLGLGAWYDERNFRLDDNGPVPGGVGRETSVPLEFSVTYRPTPNFDINGGVGTRLLNNYELGNSSGTKLADVDADATPYLMLGVNIKF